MPPRPPLGFAATPSVLHLVACLLGGFAAFCAFAPGARADVIMERPLRCPPGLAPRHTHSGSRCVAQACGESTACPAGSQCRPIDWCRRRQFNEGTGHIRPHMETATRGRCTDGACPGLEEHTAPPPVPARRRRPEASAEEEPWRCVVEHQCEPTAPTPAWDPEARRWTERAHTTAPEPPTPPSREPASTTEPAPGGGGAEVAETRAEQEPSSGGCATGVEARGAGLGWLGALGLVALLLRRREQRAAGDRAR